MKNILFAVTAAAICVADCYGTQRVTPGYGAVLKDTMCSEAKNLAHGMGYEINNYSDRQSCDCIGDAGYMIVYTQSGTNGSLEAFKLIPNK